MNAVVVVPPRAYGLDVALPILVELRERRPNLRVRFLFFDEKSYQEFDQNVLNRDVANELGEVVRIQNRLQFSRHRIVRGIGKILRYLALVPTLVRMLCSWRGILLYPSRIQGLGKILSRLTGPGGRTYCYIMVATPFTECMIQFSSAAGKDIYGKQERGESIIGNGLLAFHADNLEYLASRGYRKNIHLVGYPMKFPAYQRLVRATAKDYLLRETGSRLEDRTLVSIFLNKYQGNTTSRDDAWAARTFGEAVRVIREKIENPYILVRGHPMVPVEKLRRMVDEAGGDDIRQTFLHVFTLATLSKFVIAIAQSSSTIQSLAFGTPAIDYGRVTEDFYRLFPAGSLYADFGVQVAQSPEELAGLLDRLGREEERRAILETFQRRLGHRLDIEVLCGVRG